MSTADNILQILYCPDLRFFRRIIELPFKNILALIGLRKLFAGEMSGNRLLYVGCTRAKEKLVFAHRPDKYQWLARLNQIDTILDRSLGDGEHVLPSIDTTLVLRNLSADLVANCTLPVATSERWLSLSIPAALEPCQPRFHRPSGSAVSVLSDANCIQDLAGPLQFSSTAREDQYGAIGSAVHSYFAALPSMSGFDDVRKVAVAERCLAGFSVSGLLSPNDLVSSGNNFCRWIEEAYPGARWLTEVPVTGPRSDGGQWIGTIDVLLALPNGDVIVIDHKSAPIRREQVLAEASKFVGQLQAYREVLEAAGNTIASVFVHFPLSGALVNIGTN